MLTQTNPFYYIAQAQLQGIELNLLQPVFTQLNAFFLYKDTGSLHLACIQLLLVIIIQPVEVFCLMVDLLQNSCFRQR